MLTADADAKQNDLEEAVVVTIIADAVLAITVVCGSSCSYAAVADVATITVVAVVMTAVCGSSCSYVAAVASEDVETIADAAIVDVVAVAR